MSRIDDLLARLERVKPSGHGVWQACCPAHADRSPSMRIRECDDGKILIHCFAGCGVDSILAAVGLELDALFPETLKDGKRERSPFSHREAMTALSFEVTFLAACSNELRKGNKLSDKDHARLVLCASRLISAADYCSGRKS